MWLTNRIITRKLNYKEREEKNENAKRKRPFRRKIYFDISGNVYVLEKMDNSDSEKKTLLEEWEEQLSNIKDGNRKISTSLQNKNKICNNLLFNNFHHRCYCYCRYRSA